MLTFFNKVFQIVLRIIDSLICHTLTLIAVNADTIFFGHHHRRRLYLPVLMTEVCLPLYSTFHDYWPFLPGCPDRSFLPENSAIDWACCQRVCPLPEEVEKGSPVCCPVVAPLAVVDEMDFRVDSREDVPLREEVYNLVDVHLVDEDVEVCIQVVSPLRGAGDAMHPAGGPDKQADASGNSDGDDGPAIPNGNGVPHVDVASQKHNSTQYLQ